MSAVFAKLALYWGYPFVRYALIVGVLIALCSSLLGVTLVLKRFSFIGDGLSHVAFGAMSIAAVLGLTNDMPLTLGITILCAILLLRTGQNQGRCRHCYDLGRGVGDGVPSDEYIFYFGEPVGRCVQHAVWLHFNSDPDEIRSLAVRRAVGVGGADFRSVL